MLERAIENPTVATIITFLVVAVIAFVKGTVISGASCKERMDSMREAAVKRETELLAAIEYERSVATRWMEIGMRATGVSAELVQVAKSREMRESDHRESRGGQ